MLPTTFLRLRTTGLLFLFLICHSAEFNKIVMASAHVNPHENRLAADCLRSASARKGRCGNLTGAVSTSQAKCKLGITDMIKY